MIDGVWKMRCKICGWNEDFLGLGYTNDYQDLKIKISGFKKVLKPQQF
jgi:hypothetical protein